MVTFRGGKLGIRHRWAHKKYKKSDAKEIVRQIKKIQDKPDKPDKFYTTYDLTPHSYFNPNRKKRAVKQYIQDGDKIIEQYIGVNETPIEGLEVLFSFPVFDESSHSLLS